MQFYLVYCVNKSMIKYLFNLLNIYLREYCAQILSLFIAFFYAILSGQTIVLIGRLVSLSSQWQSAGVHTSQLVDPIISSSDQQRMDDKIKPVTFTTMTSVYISTITALQTYEGRQLLLLYYCPVVISHFVYQCII